MLDIQKEKLDKEIYKKYEKLVLNYFYSTYTNTDFTFSVINSTFLILMVVFGSLLGTFGSIFSLRRFLKFH